MTSTTALAEPKRQRGREATGAWRLLVDRRKTLGLSQKALAAQVGVSQVTMSEWERGESSPDWKYIPLIGSALGLNPVTVATDYAQNFLPEIIADSE